MDKVWLKHYPSNLAAEIHMHGDTLVSMAEDACKKYAGNTAIECDGVSKTYAQVSVYVDNLAHSLLNLGVKRGDRVALIMPNILQYPISIFAVLKIGAVVVNINPLYSVDEISYIVRDSQAKVAIVLDIIASKLRSLVSSNCVTHVIITKIADLYPYAKRLIFHFATKYIKRLDSSITYKTHDFYALATKKHNYEYTFAPVLDTDLAFIQYTGATTGCPKGAMLTHRNVVANITQVNSILEVCLDDWYKNQVVIGALPLCHVYSLTANLFIFFFTGGRHVLITNARNINQTVKVLRKTKFTVFNALDTLYNRLLSSSRFCSCKYPTYKYSVSGGMASRAFVIKKWHEVTGVMPNNCYGMTEASPVITMNFFDGVFDNSVGFPIPSTDVEIRDLKTEAILSSGQVGLVYVRGPQIMQGYWNKPEQTKDVFDSSGWFNTGDIGYLDERGKLFLTGRYSDLIIVSGFNVYPLEVETILDSLPEIKESAVVGIPDSNCGEAVIAYVVLEIGRFINESNIRLKCKEKLVSYKIPKRVIIIKVLPRALMGKIDKVSLRETLCGAIN